MITKKSKIYVAGHNGMVGSAICRQLIKLGYENILIKKKSELNLTNQSETLEFFEKNRPEYIFNCAAKVGGINANNKFSGDFILENLLISTNIIYAALHAKCSQLCNLGSSCIYPKNAHQPIKEEYLMSGYLEQTNEGYAIAKISALKLCQHLNKQYKTSYVSLMPTNLYGENDNFDLETSHVLPALIRKIHEAKIKNTKVILWGSGKPLREFLHVDDLANACIFIMEKGINEGVYNVGYGSDISIRDLASLIAKIIKFDGEIIFDNKMPDGTFRKLLDSTKINNLGWEAKISLDAGILKTYKYFSENYS